MMKKKSLALGAAALAAAVAASAQTVPAGVQLYGSLAAAVNHKTHTSKGGSVSELSADQFYASFWGVRGSEDLGDGLRGIFRLEAGVNADTGTSTNASKFWNRQSFVGIENASATLTLGRQFHASTDRIVQSFDLWNVAGSTLAVAPIAFFGVNRLAGTFDNRVDDAVKLRLRGPDGWTGAVSLAANEGTGRSRALELAQVTQRYTVGAYWLNYRNPTAVASLGGAWPEYTAWGLGGNASFGNVKVYAHYMDNTTDPLAAGRVEQRNRIVHLGVSYGATPQLVLKAGGYLDQGTGLNGVKGRDGHKETGIVTAEYYLSKRTSLHAGVYTNRFTGGYKAEATNTNANLLGRDPNASATSGYTAGVRHDF